MVSPLFDTKEKKRDSALQDALVLSTEAREGEYMVGPKLFIVIGILSMACFLMLLDVSIIITAIPYITNQFHSLSDIGWYGSSYLLTNCAVQPMTGKLYDQFNSKYTFILFLAIFELGSLICGVSQSSNMLIIGRAVAGMGASGLMNGSLTIIAACSPLEKRATNQGILMAFAQFGISIGPILGGAFTQYTSWRWCFYINLPVGGIVFIVLFLINIPKRKIATDKKNQNLLTALKGLDLQGFALFAPAAVMFLLALEWGGTTYAWNSSIVIGLFCGAAGTLLIFLAWEYKRGHAAMIPFGIVKQRVVWSSCLTMFFFAGSMLLTNYYLSIYFQAVRGASPLTSGVDILPGVLSQMLLTLISGALVSRLGYYLPSALASGVLCSVGSGLISTFTPTTSTSAWIGYQVIGGTGRGCGIQMPFVSVQTCLQEGQIPVGLTLVVFSQTFGGAIFLAFAQTVLNTGLKNYLPKYAPNVNPETVINAGATGFRAVVPQADLPGVALAYNRSVNDIFYLATASAVATFIFCWGMGWKSVKKAKRDTDTTGSDQSAQWSSRRIETQEP